MSENPLAIIPEEEALADELTSLLAPLTATQRHYLALLATYGEHALAVKGANIATKTPAQWAARHPAFKAALTYFRDASDVSKVVTLARHQLSRASAKVATDLISDASMTPKTDGETRVRHQAQAKVLEAVGILGQSRSLVGEMADKGLSGIAVRLWRNGERGRLRANEPTDTVGPGPE